MAMINKEFFVEGIPSELSLFDLTPTQTGVENIRMENVQPTSKFPKILRSCLTFPVKMAWTI